MGLWGWQHGDERQGMQKFSCCCISKKLFFDISYPNNKVTGSLWDECFKPCFLFGNWWNHSTPWSHCQHHIGFSTKATLFDFNGRSSVFFDENQDAIF